MSRRDAEGYSRSYRGWEKVPAFAWLSFSLRPDLIYLPMVESILEIWIYQWKLCLVEYYKELGSDPSRQEAVGVLTEPEGLTTVFVSEAFDIDRRLLSAYKGELLWLLPIDHYLATALPIQILLTCN